MGRSTVREAFGLRVDATPPIPGAIAPHGSRRPLVRIVDASDVGDEAQAAELLWSTVIDGEHVRVTRDPDRGFSVTFGRHGAFVISRDGRTIACAPAANADRVRWRRFLLDTVLWCAALLHGHVILHAGAVASDQGALAIVAPSGGGKSSLVAELVRRGRRLITDDVLVVTTDDVPLAHP
ncbi:MAG TPA: hypothetical protein VLA98_07985, partial [Solirubrobacteraceae bacterium]|nr:hypothetical protein [Solirubrobacteraceae bacterium]